MILLVILLILGLDSRLLRTGLGGLAFLGGRLAIIAVGAVGGASLGTGTGSLGRGSSNGNAVGGQLLLDSPENLVGSLAVFHAGLLGQSVIVDLYSRC